MGKINEKVKERMEFRGVNQVTLCRDLEFTYSNFNAFIKGRRGMPYKKMVATMRYLGLTFGKSGEEYSNIRIDEIPAYFRKCAKDLGLRNKDVQEKTGVLATTFSSFVTGSRMIQSKMIERLMGGLEIDVVQYK